jgi:hypothetical protein
VEPCLGGFALSSTYRIPLTRLATDVWHDHDTVKTRYNVIRYNEILAIVEILLCHTHFPIQITEIIVQRNRTDFALNSVISKN